jgi:hypothetical protein
MKTLISKTKPNTMHNITVVVVVLIMGLSPGFSQGFVNLDFDGADLSGYGAGPVPVANAIPGWTAYLGGTAVAEINYNVPRKGEQVDILGPGSGYPLLQGNYYVYLAGSAINSAAIGQSGTVPAATKSLIVWGNVLGRPHATFNGQALTMQALGQGPSYGIYGADISAFAGQTGPLLFYSAFLPGAGGDIIDNIQFSSEPIPEPGGLALFALCGFGLLSQLRKRISPTQKRKRVSSG